VGEGAQVVRDFDESGRGTVLVHGEYWHARGAPGAARGEKVKVSRGEGFTLRVEGRS
jgi:membrane protein implicated in regulation of membrane protease activity